MYNNSNYPYIKLSKWPALTSAIGAWVFFYLYLYYQYASGTFTKTNPIVLYALPAFFLAIASGAVGGNIYKYLFYKRDGTPITRKEVLEGIGLGLIIGISLVFILSFLSPTFTSIGIPKGIVLYSVAPETSIIVNYLHPSLSIASSISNLLSMIFSEEAVFFLIVALSEEFLVLVTFKLIEDAFDGSKLGFWSVVIIGLSISGMLWSLAHVFSYTTEGIPLLFGITFAAATGTIAFRLLSELIWHNMNFGFMASAHFAYDFVLATTIIPLSFAIVTVPTILH